MKWSSSAALTLVVERKGRRLAVVATDVGKRWLLVAIEGPAEVLSVKGLLDNHSHSDLGTARTPALACKKAETYARKWRPRALAECECEEIP